MQAPLAAGFLAHPPGFLAHPPGYACAAKAIFHCKYQYFWDTFLNACFFVFWRPPPAVRRRGCSCSISATRSMERRPFLAPSCADSSRSTRGTTSSSNRSGRRIPAFCSSRPLNTSKTKMRLLKRRETCLTIKMLERITLPAAVTWVA